MLYIDILLIYSILKNQKKEEYPHTTLKSQKNTPIGKSL
ncbi:hypothetical protein EZS27_036546, partial [termite gut metagenome]